MALPLVECIPNFSEARRPDVVDAIIQAIQAVDGVTILDHSSDLDHNRTVVTYVGTPAAVEEAAFQAIEKAAQLINLDHHTGEHPRIGATDVVPFVPLSGVTMVDCIEMARRLAKRVGETLNIPVYLYEEAAIRPERQNLEDIRRGEYEGLKSEIETNPDRAPDFGPTHLSAAGATVVGARQPLIAFNVYLNTADVDIARKIAKAVRNSSGGLRYVKAMGVLVEGLAQVSMNLTNYHQTPVARVVELVRRESSRYGVAIHHSELIGLIPQEALVDVATWHLQLDAFSPDQVLETRLQQLINPVTESTASEPAFLDQLAAGTPTPGGGSAAAYVGAAGAALVAMVARLTIGKKKYVAVESQMWNLVERAEILRRELTEAVRLDADAFEAYMTANRMPKNTPAEQDLRTRALEEATLHAAEVPLSVARKSVQVIELALQAATSGNSNAISDAGAAAALARAGLTGASLNVRANVLLLANQDQAGRMVAEIKTIETRASGLETQLRSVLIERGNLDL